LITLEPFAPRAEIIGKKGKPLFYSSISLYVQMDADKAAESVPRGLMLIVSRDWESSSSSKERREKGLRAEEGFMIVCVAARREASERGPCCQSSRTFSLSSRRSFLRSAPASWRPLVRKNFQQTLLVHI
jgi:hypothetical protein